MRLPRTIGIVMFPKYASKMAHFYMFFTSQNSSSPLQWRCCILSTCTDSCRIDSNVSATGEIFYPESKKKINKMNKDF
jgi:hypothetical protein